MARLRGGLWVCFALGNRLLSLSSGFKFKC